MGIEKQLIKEGSGPYPTKGQKVQVNFTPTTHYCIVLSRADFMMMIAQIFCIHRCIARATARTTTSLRSSGGAFSVIGDQ